MSWNSNTISLEEIFEKILEFLEEKAGSGTGLYIINHGEFSAGSLGAWTGILMIFGRRILRYARGLAIMRGRQDPNDDDFRQVLHLIDNGFISLLSRSRIRSLVQPRFCRRQDNHNENDGSESHSE